MREHSRFVGGNTPFGGWVFGGVERDVRCGDNSGHCFGVLGGERMFTMADENKDEKGEFRGELTSNDTEPVTKEPTLKEKVETVEISSMKPSATEYTK